MIRYIALAVAAMLVAGCETTADTSFANLKPRTLPEYTTHNNCLRAKVQEYAYVEGSPLELGTIASASCNSTRYALYEALVKATNKYYAQGYIEESDKQDPKLVAALIIKARQQ